MEPRFLVSYLPLGEPLVELPTDPFGYGVGLAHHVVVDPVHWPQDISKMGVIFEAGMTASQLGVLAGLLKVHGLELTFSSQTSILSNPDKEQIEAFGIEGFWRAPGVKEPKLVSRWLAHVSPDYVDIPLRQAPAPAPKVSWFDLLSSNGYWVRIRDPKGARIKVLDENREELPDLAVRCQFPDKEWMVSMGNMADWTRTKQPVGLRQAMEIARDWMKPGSTNGKGMLEAIWGDRP